MKSCNMFRSNFEFKFNRETGSPGNRTNSLRRPLGFSLGVAAEKGLPVMSRAGAPREKCQLPESPATPACGQGRPARLRGEAGKRPPGAWEGGRGGTGDLRVQVAGEA